MIKYSVFKIFNTEWVNVKKLITCVFSTVSMVHKYCKVVQ